MDPDSLNPDPDTDPDPAFQVNADPDADPRLKAALIFRLCSMLCTFFGLLPKDPED